MVDRPDRKGRQKILEVHTRGKPLAKAIDLDVLAGQTPGFTGADLQNLVNEAALLAARQGKREIDHLQLEEGIMRVIAGPEKKTRVMSEKERRVTAFHEMGHALVAHFLENTDPVHKISVISRGQALGYTISLPTEDKFLTTRAELSDTMAMTLGGRAAEEIVFGEVTTGASNDLEKVTATAKQMVMRFGMSEKLGPRVFGHDHGQPFLGREFSSEPDYSDEIAREIDDEIRRIVEEAHQTARQVLEDQREALDLTSEILLKRETIEREQFIELLDGKSEDEVFGTEEPPVPALPPAAPEAPERKPDRAPKPLPRPGLAGGTAEMRASDLPPAAASDYIASGCRCRAERLTPAPRSGVAGLRELAGQVEDHDERADHATTITPSTSAGDLSLSAGSMAACIRRRAAAAPARHYQGAEQLVAIAPDLRGPQERHAGPRGD